MMISWLLILLLFVLIFHILVHYGRKGRLINKIPGPTPLPLFGNMLLFHRSPDKVFEICRDMSNKYYPIYRLWFTTSSLVVIRHPEDIKAVLTSKINIEKSNLGYENYKFCIKGGVFLDGGEKWHQRRRMLNLAFHQNIIKNYLDIVNKHAKNFVESMQSTGEECILNFTPLLMKLTLTIICEAAMGINLDELDNEIESKYRDGFDTVNETSFYRIFRPYIRNWMMTFLNVGLKQDRALKVGRIFVGQVIKKRQDYFELHGYHAYQDFIDDNTDDKDNENFNVRRKKLILLDLLLTAKKEGLIDDDGIVEEVNTFIAAGYETVAIAITFILVCLAENTEAQDAVRAELYNITQGNEENITVNNIAKCEFLDRCIKESLRLFPSGPIIGRCLEEDIQLRNYRIPAKTEVAITFYDLHRDPEYWPNPEKFNPDRFLPEFVKKRHSHAYLPFSAGPRNCIGQKFAMQEMKLLVGRILHNFHVKPQYSFDTLKFDFNVVLKSTHPIHFKFVRIDKT